MTYPADGYEADEKSPESSASLPVTNDSSDLEEGQPAAEDVATATAQVDAAVIDPSEIEAAFEEAGAQADFAVSNTLAQVEERYTDAAQAYETSSEVVRSSFEEIAMSMNQLSWKLMEFARINAQNNFDFARDYASVRSVPDVVQLQTAYMRRQYDLFTAQMQELQSLTAKIAQKSAAPLKDQFIRTSQAFRSH